jgi:NADH-quinone oxidoreductase subunit H
MAEFWHGFALPLIIILAQVLLVLVPLLLTVAMLVYADRKIWAAVQIRRGPNVVGPFGLFQSFADFLKMVFKETIVPAGANKVLFFLAPLITFTLAMVAWAVIPFDEGWVVSDINVGILYLLAMSSLGVYGIIMGGWASNSKYPFLGALRSTAQMVSYEVSIGFVIVSVLLLVGSLNLSAIVLAQEHLWFGLPMLPMFIVFFISALAETSRPPFDLPEAEAELVAGYQVEYSSTSWLLFMIGEYTNVVLMCAMMTILFLGGWLPPLVFPPYSWIPGFVDLMYAIPGFTWFTLKGLFLFFLIGIVKSMVPRYRYDQLMRLGWKVFLPLSLFWLVLTAGVLTAFDWAP